MNNEKCSDTSVFSLYDLSINDSNDIFYSILISLVSENENRAYEGVRAEVH